MPFIHAGGLRQYYRLDGTDDRPVIIFSHSLGCDHTQWDPQAADLLHHFRVLRYDLRGHGASDVTPGDYTVEMLSRDVLALADALDIPSFVFCGLSLGGMIGQWLAAHSSNRLTSAVLANTSSRFPDPSVMEERRRIVLEQGMPALESMVMQRFFSPANLGSPETARIRRVLLSTDRIGYAGCCAAVRDLNQTASLSSIRIPVLLIAGDHDVSTPWQGHVEVLAREIPHARVAHFPTAHLSNLERPAEFTAALSEFLASRSAGSGG